jgi:hypothetical protein
MARAITVKVPTAKVITALEARLVKTTNEQTTNGAKEAQYQADYKVWEAQIKTWALARVEKAVNLRSNYRSWSNTINLDFDVPTSEGDFPVEPKRDWENRNDWQIKEEVEEINNALNILRMTEEEFVNASTMKSISKYL